MKDFVHLHLHTEYSLLDGAARIDKVIKACKKKGMHAIAITDHGNMFGTLKFAETAKKVYLAGLESGESEEQAKMQAIIGCELYASSLFKSSLNSSFNSGYAESMGSTSMPFLRS